MENLNPELLFSQLRKLVSEKDSSFIELKYNFEGRFLSIFDYRLASYSDFLKEGAIESRGIMFETTENGEYISLLSLPMPKFFNYKENPSTIGVENYTINQCLTKEDGSLISHFMLDDNLFFKSKGSVFSNQATKVNEYAQRNPFLQGVLKELSQDGFTANFEYTSPDNRIVLFYPEEELILLNARSMKTGKFMAYDDLSKIATEANLKFVQSHTQYHGVEVDQFYNEVKNLDKIEGFVIDAEKDGHYVSMKIKTIPYKEKHKIKDFIDLNNTSGKESIFKLTLLGTIDDVKNDLLLNISDEEKRMVEEFENKCVTFFNHEVSNVEKFLNMNIQDRKEYAITAKTFNFSSPTFGILMQLFNQEKKMSFNDIAETVKSSLINNANKIVKDLK